MAKNPLDTIGTVVHNWRRGLLSEDSALARIRELTEEN